MKKAVFISILSILSWATYAQQVNIKGNILEKGTNTPLSYVNVVLMHEGAITKAASTNNEGMFFFDKVKPGTYLVKVSFVGYKNYEKTIKISGKNLEINMGNIFVEEDSKTLKELEIVTQGSQVKFDIDKKVFSVDQSIATAGGNASDVLENIPSVAIDNDGNVSLRNNANVEIWINGKPSGLSDENRAQVLEQMPAGGIQSVEIITNPSAKYSPEGSAGIINLVMKKERKAGFYGSINAGLMAYTGSKKLGQVEGINLNFNVGKFDGYFNSGYRSRYHNSESVVDRTYFNQNQTIYELHQNSSSINEFYGSMTRYGLNYQLNDKNTIGVSGYFLLGYRDGDSYLDYKKDSAQVLLADYMRENNFETERYITNTVLDHGLEIDKNTNIKTSLLLKNFRNFNDANYIQQVNSGNVGNVNQIQNTNSNNFTLEFKSDFVKKFNDKNKLELGVNYKSQGPLSTSNAGNIENGTYVELDYMYNKYKYSEQLYALYGTYGMKINKLSIQAGLRGEYIHIENSTNGVSNPSKDYLQPFPTVFLSYELPQKNEIQFNYTRRINRPRGRQLNSYKDVSDSSNIRYGNPDLEPEFASSFELNHIKNWENHTLSTSIAYMFNDNVIQSINFLNNGLLNSTYMNISQSQSSGFEMVLKNNFTKAFSVTSTLNMYYYSLIASDFEASPTQIIHIDGNEDFSWNARILANFMLSKTLSGQITGKYNSPTVIAQGTRSESYSVDFGLRKSFFDKKLNLALSIKDVFDTGKNESTTSTNNFIQYYNARHFAPEYRLTATYNFGNNKKKNGKKGKDDENNQQEEMEEY